ncbi:Uu.00g132230.m01.CDS01 [Anthostomella pinea]|uniref:Uu.00g132230.m01.CDS01 n=1 Tax=Anthostomella pinea TaxID=933095 RepID=A0AAI8VK58_9PEZI|nr:Uu.00g132230.m01.CDS01 [Anthostomella pinea]
MLPPDSAHVLVHIVLLAVIVFASHPGPYDAHDDVHASLLSVLARGQLVIESFVPIPLLLGLRVPATASALLGIGTQILSVLIVMLNSAVCLGSYVGVVDLSTWSPSASLAQLSSLLSVSVPLYTQHSLFLGSTEWLERWLGVCEVIIGICGALGANLYDLVALSFVLLVARITQVAGGAGEKEDQEPTRDRGHWKDLGSVVLLIPLLMLRSVLATLVVPVLIYGTLFHFSESHIALHPARRFPLDKLVWVDAFGVFGSHGESAEEEDQAQRVFVVDPLVRRHPWALELASVPDDLDDRQREYVHSHLAPGEMVHLRSRTTGRYLAPVEGRPSIMDRELGVGYEHDAQFRRWEVSARFNRLPSWNTIWILKYDQRRDTGLRLYNPANKSSLATSFRTYVDYDGDRSNNTVQREMQQIVEATCTTGASDQASTLWIVDGGPRPDNKRLSAIQRGQALVLARVDLHRWRSLHGTTLELLPRPPFAGSQVSQFAKLVKRLVLGTFAVLDVLCRLRRQRLGGMGPSGTSAKKTVEAFAVPVWVHILVFWGLGFPRANGNQTALMLAILSLGSIWHEMKGHVRVLDRRARHRK